MGGKICTRTETPNDAVQVQGIKTTGYLEESSRESFVCGLMTESIRKRLLTGAELTFTKAVEIAQSLETAPKVAQELAVNDPDAGRSNVRRVATPSSGRAVKLACFRCSQRPHKSAECRFKGVSCFNCGHSKSTYRSRVRAHVSLGVSG